MKYERAVRFATGWERDGELCRPMHGWIAIVNCLPFQGSPFSKYQRGEGDR